MCEGVEMMNQDDIGFEVVVFTGIPASGKTTFYRERFFPTHVYISLDQVGSRSAESELLEFCLRRNRACVVDNTNVRRSERGRYIAAAKAAGARVVGYCFVTDRDAAIARNASRTGRARVPEVAIRAKYCELEYPRVSEGYDELYYVTAGEGNFKMEAYDEDRAG